MVQPQADEREQRYSDWTDLQFPQGEYEVRRSRLIDALRDAGGGVFLAPAAAGTSHGETFRQLDNFFYFTGLELPNSIVAVDADRDMTIAFAPRRDARFENPSRQNDFPGRPLADDSGLARMPNIRIAAFEGFDSFIRTVMRDGRPIWIDLGRNPSSATPEPGPIHSWNPEEALLFHLRNADPTSDVQNAFPHIARLRMVKSPAETAVMRRAAELTVDAIRHAATFVNDGIDERRLEGEFELACKRSGAQRVAFSSIVKSGPNALWPWRILASHYDRRNRPMIDGELVIFDVGCELDHYVSDVGRTFPVSGQFTSDQRTALEMITTVADSVIARVRAGITLGELIEIGVRQIPPSERKYMPTTLFFGHHLGLATGDPSLLDIPLETGMIFTVEPWYYNHDRNLSVFIEDEVLVTSDGAEVLTRGLPRAPEDLERLVHAQRPH